MGMFGFTNEKWSNLDPDYYVGPTSKVVSKKHVCAQICCVYYFGQWFTCTSVLYWPDIQMTYNMLVRRKSIRK